MAELQRHYRLIGIGIPVGPRHKQRKRAGRAIHSGADGVPATAASPPCDRHDRALVLEQEEAIPTTGADYRSARWRQARLAYGIRVKACWGESNDPCQCCLPREAEPTTPPTAPLDETRAPDERDPLDASARRRWRESSKRSSASVRVGGPFRGIGIVGPAGGGAVLQSPKRWQARPRLRGECDRQRGLPPAHECSQVSSAGNPLLEYAYTGHGACAAALLGDR